MRKTEHWQQILFKVDMAGVSWLKNRIFSIVGIFRIPPFFNEKYNSHLFIIKLHK